MKINKISFGKKLKKIRTEKGLTAEKLAEACDLSVIFLRQIESGKKLPSISNLVRLCNALKISPDYLLADDLNIDDNDTIETIIQKLKTLSPKELNIIDATITAMKNFL